MPANIPFIPQFIQDFLHRINGKRETHAERQLHDDTEALTPVIETVQHLYQPMGVMGISAEESNLLALLTRMLGDQHEYPLKALDIGTFTGGSALAMAKAMRKGGNVISCDLDTEKTKEPLAIARKAWKGSGVDDRIDLRLAPASETLDQLLADGHSGTFDIAFIDADKVGYKDYYEKALTLLRPGGLIVLDNMLWSGRVAQASVDDKSTNAIRELDEFIAEDTRVEHVLLGNEDGIMVARKCGEWKAEQKKRSHQGRNTTSQAR